jgi:hypothetical protein
MAHLDIDLSGLNLNAHMLGSMTCQCAGSVSPSPRFAESAEQNGERAGVRCFVLILAFFAFALTAKKSVKLSTNCSNSSRWRADFYANDSIRSQIKPAPGSSKAASYNNRLASDKWPFSIKSSAWAQVAKIKVILCRGTLLPSRSALKG